MISFAIDTSALISLGHTDHCDILITNFNLVVTPTIIIELEKISQFEDEDSKASRKWLEMKGRFQVCETSKKEHGEEELFELCRTKDHILVSDDLKAIKRYDSEVECIMSVHMLYLAMKKGLISRGETKTAMRKMKEQRDWKSNMIAVTGGYLLLEKEKGNFKHTGNKNIHERAEEYAYQEVVEVILRGKKHRKDE